MGTNMSADSLDANSGDAPWDWEETLKRLLRRGKVKAAAIFDCQGHLLVSVPDTDFSSVTPSEGVGLARAAFSSNTTCFRLPFGGTRFTCLQHKEPEQAVVGVAEDIVLVATKILLPPPAALDLQQQLLQHQKQHDKPFLIQQQKRIQHDQHKTPQKKQQQLLPHPFQDDDEDLDVGLFFHAHGANNEHIYGRRPSVIPELEESTTDDDDEDEEEHDKNDDENDEADKEGNDKNDADEEDEDENDTNDDADDEEGEEEKNNNDVDAVDGNDDDESEQNGDDKKEHEEKLLKKDENCNTEKNANEEKQNDEPYDEDDADEDADDEEEEEEEGEEEEEEEEEEERKNHENLVNTTTTTTTTTINVSITITNATVDINTPAITIDSNNGCSNSTSNISDFLTAEEQSEVLLVGLARCDTPGSCLYEVTEFARSVRKTLVAFWSGTQRQLSVPQAQQGGQVSSTLLRQAHSTRTAS